MSRPRRTSFFRHDFSLVATSFFAIVWPLLASALLIAASTASAERAKFPNEVTDQPLLNARFLLSADATLRRETLEWATRGSRTDMVAAMVRAMRYQQPKAKKEINRALRDITGERVRGGDEWFACMQWLEAHPEVEPFADFELYLSAVLARIDRTFLDFVYPNIEHTIRLEEIVWGGVAAKTGIPALDHPKMIPASEATYLGDNERVFEIVINGDIRAYPYRFMDWHEMLNDTIGGEPVALAYCTLCASGILYSARRGEADGRYVFGSSGLRYRSNKLMYDVETDTLWNQFSGRPAAGRLVGRGITLAVLPLVTTTWREWRRLHPDTVVMHPVTEFERNYEYTAQSPYESYFSSKKLMFPAVVDDREQKPKTRAFVLRVSGAERAWPLRAFRGGKVLNDRLRALHVVLVGDARSRSVRAYRGNGSEFTKARDLTQVLARGAAWSVTEEALVGPDGQRLTRLPGHLAYWFAWQGYFD